MQSDRLSFLQQRCPANLFDYLHLITASPGSWSGLVASIGDALAAAGYTKVGTCPTSDGEQEGSVSWAKVAGEGNGDVVSVGLSVFIKSSGHFFLELRRAELRSLWIMENCSLTEDAAELCEPSGTICSFK